MWIQVEDSIAFNTRAMIASITVQDFVNFASGSAKEFFELFRRGIDPNVAEVELRSILEAVYPDAKNWTLFQCGFSMSRQALEVVVAHPSFPLSRVGSELQRVDRQSRDDS